MKKNLTLTLDKEVVENAKKIAKENNQSLSQMFENHLKFLTTGKRKVVEIENLPKVKTNQKNKGIDLIAQSEYNSKAATNHELSSPKNQKRLDFAIKKLRNKNVD